jgi:effector-binding domain-containing protein
VHGGFEVKDPRIRGGDGVQVHDLPVVQVASVVHRGSMDNVGASYDALMRWIEDSGYRLVGRSRELYFEWYADDQSKNVTELQLPIARA